jgi:hypothetical protein
MTYRPDFIDELTDYATKMRQEYLTIDDVLEQAVMHSVKVKAARKLLSEAEQGRLAFSNALRPFLPEPAPTPLQSAPTPQFNGHYRDPNLDTESEFFGSELHDDLEMPRVARGRG